MPLYAHCGRLAGPDLGDAASRGSRSATESDKRWQMTLNHAPPERTSSGLASFWRLSRYAPVRPYRHAASTIMVVVSPDRSTQSAVKAENGHWRRGPHRDGYMVAPPPTNGAGGPPSPS